MKLRSDLSAAKKNGNPLLVDNIQADIQQLKEESQGNIPRIRGGTYKSKSPMPSPEEYAKQIEKAERDLFRKYGIEHLYGVLY